MPSTSAGQRTVSPGKLEARFVNRRSRVKQSGHAKIFSPLHSHQPDKLALSAVSR
jgi:hypothetical protein